MKLRHWLADQAEERDLDFHARAKFLGGVTAIWTLSVWFFAVAVIGLGALIWHLAPDALDWYRRFFEWIAQRLGQIPPASSI
ncbi:hypothetical protein [Mangrovicoccus sp. HB161399]|uniref:hypothetical protein n=1 Tax=Mangrovicoccus sp. HB161399 TaxID=2720392 RepID=UPI0015553191|nr:hypothetical protein [Mangrovicoccus sp. HB161399]